MTYSYTLHSMDRAHERAGLSKKSALSLIEHAYCRGKHAEEMPELEQHFMRSIETHHPDSVLTYYNEYLFVFSESHVCLTMYKAPGWFFRKHYFNGKDQIRKTKRYARLNPQLS